jgi:hypothetical protein
VDLSPGQQKAVFAVVVIVLAALGYWLIAPKLSHSHTTAQASATASAPATSAASTPSPTPTVTGNASGVNIYSWLPFTQQDLANAAAVTVKFCVDYDTYTYTESASAYTGKMGALVTGQFATSLQNDFATPGVASLRKSEKQVSSGTAAISSLRAFGSSSLTFVVNARQRLVSSKGTSTGTTQYAVTVVSSGSGWQVDDIELASAGNF